MSRSAYKFNRDFQTAILKALGLEGRRIRRIVLEMEVDQPVQLRVDEYATFDNGQPYLIAKVFELASFVDLSGAALPSESKATNPNTEGTN